MVLCWHVSCTVQVEMHIPGAVNNCATHVITLRDLVWQMCCCSCFCCFKLLADDVCAVSADVWCYLHWLGFDVACGFALLASACVIQQRGLSHGCSLLFVCVHHPCLLV